MLVAALAIVAVGLMAWLQVRDVRRIKRIRREAVVSAQGALTDVEIAQDGMAYPVLRGRFGGHPAKAELIVDTVTIRQLPRLWLAVTVQCPTGAGVPVDILLRPLPTDIVSPGMRFRYVHRVPPDWPAHMRIATREAGPLPPLGDVAALESVVLEPETKSVFVTARGVRIVTEVARGDVAPYRVTRRADFRFELAESRLRHVLGEAVAVARDMNGVRVET
jgi:hypothetical protein